MASLRGSRIVYVNNASSCVFAFPVGSVAGDGCVIFAAHGYGISIPAGWTQIDSSPGTNVTGVAFTKILNSTDIANGSVTVTFGGTYYGAVAGITIVGGIDHISGTAFGRNSFGAASRTIAASTASIAGDYAIYFAFGRGNVVVTSSSGTGLQTTSNTNASAVLAGDSLAVDGAASSTFGFSASPSGDYEAIVVVSTTPSIRNEITKTGIVSVLRPPVANIVLKMGAVAVLRPTPASPSGRRRMSFM